MSLRSSWAFTCRLMAMQLVLCWLSLRPCSRRTVVKDVASHQHSTAGFNNKVGQQCLHDTLSWHLSLCLARAFQEVPADEQDSWIFDCLFFPSLVRGRCVVPPPHSPHHFFFLSFPFSNWRCLLQGTKYPQVCQPTPMGKKEVAQSY